MRCIGARAIFTEIEGWRRKLRKCASQHGGGERELNRVHMSPKRACHRVEKRRYIWRASICRSPLIWQHLHTAYSLWAIYSLANSPLLAFGHQCVWLTLLVAPLTPDYISICIHSRTSLSPTARTIVPPSFRLYFSVFRPAPVPTIGQRFSFWCRVFRAVIHVSYFSTRECAQGAGATSIDASDLAGAAISLDGGAICYAFLGTVLLRYSSRFLR